MSGMKLIVFAGMMLVGSSASAQMSEARALWVTRFDYDSEAKIGRIMETAAKANFNIVYFQVRASSDAYYKSEIEPCASRLCGKLGGTPTYDPLAVAVREGQKRGLEVQRTSTRLLETGGDRRTVQSDASPDPGKPRHVLLDHPEWTMADGRASAPCPNSEEYIWLSPSYPQCARSSRALPQIS